MNKPGVEICTLLIENRECGGRSDQTILEVAEEYGDDDEEEAVEQHAPQQ